jgi:hypothetical protein
MVGQADAAAAAQLKNIVRGAFWAVNSIFQVFWNQIITE